VLASLTDGWSGAEIASACRKAALKAVRRVVEAEKDPSTGEGDLLLKPEDMEAALKEVQSP
jgi:SpoVK/Ycf46/Vps4 family AAA+-type ATPase